MLDTQASRLYVFRNLLRREHSDRPGERLPRQPRVSDLGRLPTVRQGTGHARPWGWVPGQVGCGRRFCRIRLLLISDDRRGRCCSGHAYLTDRGKHTNGLVSNCLKRPLIGIPSRTSHVATASSHLGCVAKGGERLGADRQSIGPDQNAKGVTSQCFRGRECCMCSCVSIAEPNCGELYQISRDIPSCAIAIGNLLHNTAHFIPRGLKSCQMPRLAELRRSSSPPSKPP